MKKDYTQSISMVMDRLFFMSDTSFSMFLACSSSLLFANSIFGGYVWDDRAAIVGNADVHGSTSLWEMLQHDFWGQGITLSDRFVNYIMFLSTRTSL